MASVHPLREIFAALSAPEKITDDCVKWPGPHMGGPFFMKRVFGGQTFAMAYLSLRILVCGQYPTNMHANLFRPAHAEKPVLFRLASRHGHGLAVLHVVQEEKVIGIFKFRLVSDQNAVMISSERPYAVPSNIEKCTLVTDMHSIAPHPTVAKYSDMRFNKEWLMHVRIVDDEHFFGQSHEKKPVQTVNTLNRKVIGPILDTFDPVAALLLLADFMVFQSVKNVFGSLNKSEECTAGSTMNFTVFFYNTKGIKATDTFLLENWLQVLSHSAAFLPGRIFDLNGRCLMSYAQESFVSPVEVRF